MRLVALVLAASIFSGASNATERQPIVINGLNEFDIYGILIAQGAPREKVLDILPRYKSRNPFDDKRANDSLRERTLQVAADPQFAGPLRFRYLDFSAGYSYDIDRGILKVCYSQYQDSLADDGSSVALTIAFSVDPHNFNNKINCLNARVQIDLPLADLDLAEKLFNFNRSRKDAVFGETTCSGFYYQPHMNRYRINCKIDSIEIFGRKADDSGAFPLVQIVFQEGGRYNYRILEPQ